MELIPPKKDQQEIISLLDHHPKKAEIAVKKMTSNHLQEAEVDVTITKVEFKEMDSDNLNHGAAYFEVTLKGSKAELEKIAGDDLLFIYDWENPSVEGLSNNSKHNLTLRNNVSMLDATKNKTMKKTVNKGDWTKPKHLNPADWRDLKIIKKYCDKDDFESAMNHAMNCDTVIREEIPSDVWKKMGGQLTKTGEEKLKAMKTKSTSKVAEQKIKKPVIVFNHGVRMLKGVIEREWDLELTDADYIEILDIAQQRSANFPEVINTIHDNLSEFLTIIKKALNEWDAKTGKSAEKSREKFDPQFYANRNDDENPAFIFSLTSTKLLSEALQGDFDLVYLVRKELANRGQDSKGKWVGFDEAKKLHRVD